MIRLGFIIGLMATIGVLLSGLAAYRFYTDQLSLERSAFAQSVDTHAALVQERLSERELLARVAVGLFRVPSGSRANVLQPLRASIYAFKADFVLAGWIARVSPTQLEAAQGELKAAGFPDSSIRNFDDAALPLGDAKETLDVLMDVEPQDDMTGKFAGRALNRQPIIGPVLTQILATNKPASTVPVQLLRTGGPYGIVLIAPVTYEGAKEIAGFVTFSYRIAPLMLANTDKSPFTVTLSDPRETANELSVDPQGEVVSIPVAASQRVTSGDSVRTVNFGGRDWTLNYFPQAKAAAHPQEVALTVLIAGVALTSILCGMFGYVAFNNIRLTREVQTRINFERRLTAVIDELNHRVKNILAVIQSIVTRSLRHGADIDTARELLIGRIHAMSNVVTLLSDSQWQGVKLRGLFESRAIPHANRIELDGPDITVSARAAQSLSLLFFELASHADEGLSLVGKHPRIVAHWDISNDESGSIFNFRWEEFNTSAATRRPESDFGQVLLDRVAPEALGGTAKRHFTDVSYVYELSAPMDTVIDLPEANRTGYITRQV